MRNRITAAAIGLGIALACASALPAAAQDASVDESADTSGWRFSLTPYVWAVSLDGDARVGPVDADVDAPFHDTVKDLSFGVMAYGEARKERLAIFVNPVFSRVSDSVSEGGVKFDTKADIGVFGAGVAYRVGEWNASEQTDGVLRKIVLEPLVGFRWTYLRVELDGKNGLPSADKNENWFDPVIGTRAGVGILDRWQFGVEGDVGGFGVGSDFTWQAVALVGYRFEMLGLKQTLQVGYRALDQEYDHNNFKWNVIQHGPVIGLTTSF
jgi:hypothetical protein